MKTGHECRGRQIYRGIYIYILQQSNNPIIRKFNRMIIQCKWGKAVMEMELVMVMVMVMTV